MASTLVKSEKNVIWLEKPDSAKTALSCFIYEIINEDFTVCGMRKFWPCGKKKHIVYTDAYITI